jgi:hypothetical protein
MADDECVGIGKLLAHLVVLVCDVRTTIGQPVNQTQCLGSDSHIRITTMSKYTAKSALCTVVLNTMPL